MKDKAAGLHGMLTSHRYLFLAAFCALLYLSNLGGYLLFDVDEPRYAETARQMVETGDYVVPRFNGDYRFEKPVMTYWLIAGCYHVFGINEFAARLPSALSATGSVLLACLLATRLAGAGAGLGAGIILACCLQFFALGRMSLTDMPLSFFITATLVLLYLAIEEDCGRRRKRYYLAALLASGLAVLTKGPVGFVLPAGIAFCYMALRGYFLVRLRQVPWATGVLVFVVCVLPWYVLVTLRSDFEFFNTFIIRHNVDRFLGKVTETGQHVEPFYYYLPALLAGAYPWTFFVPQALLSPLARLYRRFRDKRSLDDRALFPLLWALLVLLFFSLSRTKLPTYITPAFPPLAILLALYLRRFLKAPGSTRQPAALIPVALGTVAALAGAWYLVFRAPAEVDFALGGLPLLTALALSGGPLAALALLLWRKPKPLAAFAARAAGQAAFLLVVASLVLPLVSAHRQAPQKRLIERSREFTGTGGTLAAYRYRKTAMTFYSSRKVVYLEAQHDVTALDTLDAPVAIICRQRYCSQFLSSFPSFEPVAMDEDLFLAVRKE